MKLTSMSKTSGPDYVPVVLLQNCEPELSYILAELFTKCLKQSCFPDCWKVLVVHLGPTLFLVYINDLPDDVICYIAIYADDTTLYSKCDQASDLRQLLELACQLESGPQDSVDQVKKWLIDFNAGKTQLVSFDQCNGTGAVDVKTDVSLFSP